MIDGSDEERVGHAEASTAIAAKNGTAPQWSDAERGRFHHVASLPHTMFEVTLWGRKNGVDETLGSYKLWLKPENFEESKALHQVNVVLSGTKFNIPHPDDVAAQKRWEQAGSPAGEKPKLLKELPSVQIDLFCRQVCARALLVAFVCVC